VPGTLELLAANATALFDASRMLGDHVTTPISTKERPSSAADTINTRG
jgi:hypothetical protein